MVFLKLWYLFREIKDNVLMSNKAAEGKTELNRKDYESNHFEKKVCVLDATITSKSLHRGKLSTIPE